MRVVAVDLDGHLLAELLPSGAAMIALRAARILNPNHVIGKVRTNGELGSLRISGFRHSAPPWLVPATATCVIWLTRTRRRLLIGRPLCYKTIVPEASHEIAWISKITRIFPRCRAFAGGVPAGFRRKARGAGAWQFRLSKRGAASQPGQ